MMIRSRAAAPPAGRLMDAQVMSACGRRAAQLEPILDLDATLARVQSSELWTARASESHANS